MTAAPVVVEHVTKNFGRARGIVDVSLTVEQGHVVGFLGPNGAGKSTTIRCLLGLYRPDRGQVTTLGADPARADRRFLRDVGYVPGELTLPATLTGADLLARFSRLRGGVDASHRDRLVERLRAQTDRPIGTLSKGNKQKLGLVLAFMHRPRLLVLDEPTSGLDPLLQEEFAALVRETVDEGRTVLLSSHDLEEVQRLAERVVVIREGHIVADDTVASLRAKAPHTMELTFDHDADASALVTLPGVTVTNATPRRVALTHTGSVAPLLDTIAALAPQTMTARPADLDELFHRLYDTPREVVRHAR